MVSKLFVAEFTINFDYWRLSMARTDLKFITGFNTAKILVQAKAAEYILNSKSSACGGGESACLD